MTRSSRTRPGSPLLVGVLVASLAGPLAGVVGCRKGPKAEGGAPAAPTTGGSATPPDRLATNEVAPGQEKAHDLVLPRGSTLDRKYGATVYATVPLAPEVAANWVRRQADGPEAVVGPSGTVFPKVFVTGAATDHWLRIEVARGGAVDESTLIVDRVENVPSPTTTLSNEELWKKAGFTADGKPLDPKHLD